MKTFLIMLAAASFGIGTPDNSDLCDAGKIVADTQDKTKDPDEFIKVDQQPSVKHQKPPKYPESARKFGVQGTIYYKAIVTEEGTVTKISIIRSEYTADEKKIDPAKGTPEMYKAVEELNKAGEEALKEWKFSPAILKGKPARIWVTIPIKFKLDMDKGPKK